MSFLWGRFEVGEGGLPSPLSSPKLVRTMLKTSNLVYTYTHTCVVSENIPVSTNVLLILLMSAFFCKKSTL